MENLELKQELIDFIKEDHSYEETIGFIVGFKKAEKIYREQLKAEIIAKEHFMNQSTKCLINLEEIKQNTINNKKWWSDLSDRFYESKLLHDCKDGKVNYRTIKNWFLKQTNK